MKTNKTILLLVLVTLTCFVIEGCNSDEATGEITINDYTYETNYAVLRYYGGSDYELMISSKKLNNELNTDDFTAITFSLNKELTSNSYSYQSSSGETFDDNANYWDNTTFEKVKIKNGMLVSNSGKQYNCFDELSKEILIKEDKLDVKINEGYYEISYSLQVADDKIEGAFKGKIEVVSVQ